MKNQQNDQKSKKIINLLELLFLITITSVIGSKIASWIKSQPGHIQFFQSLEVQSLPPKGLYSYGGAAIFAPLVASGLNGAIESKYPGFELRYTKPWNQDYSSINGIKMLLDGELSFAYNERSLSAKEYSQAQLRGIKLKQVGIAIDGVSVFGNSKSNFNYLTKAQVVKIFKGEIRNWKNLNSSSKSFPIIPILVKNENLQLLGIKAQKENNPNTQYVQNYTQALRKVIATEGAISLASASLVRSQKLIKIFSVSDGVGAVSPIKNNLLNLDDFKSNKYPLTRKIFLVYRDDQTSDRLAAEAYINFIMSKEGQFILGKSGFVGLHQ